MGRDHGNQNNDNGDVKDHWSQIAITKITIMKIMKKFEIMKPKCDMKWANAIGRMALMDLLFIELPQTLNL